MHHQEDDIFQLKYKKTRRLQALCESILRGSLDPASVTGPGPRPTSAISSVGGYSGGHPIEQPLNLSKTQKRSASDSLDDNDRPTKPAQPVRPRSDKNLIQELIENDRLDELINLRGLRTADANDDEEEDAVPPCQRLSRIGDEIVEKLVEWTKVLPFYVELPVEVHTHLLTKRWAELVLLSACFYATVHAGGAELNVVSTPVSSTTAEESTDVERLSFCDANVNLRLLQKRLSAVMGKDVPFEHVNREAGALVDKFTALLNSFSRLRLTVESYVCLKAITLLHPGIPPFLLLYLSLGLEVKVAVP